MAIESSSLGRDLAGFAVGSVTGALVVAMVFVQFVEMPPFDKPRDYAWTVLTAVVLVAFVAGGIVGRRGLSADTLLDLIPSGFGSIAFASFLSLMTGLSWKEMAPLLALLTLGVVVSAACSIGLQKFFPQKPPVDSATDDSAN